MQVQRPLQMSNMVQVLLVDICWDHMLKPHQHLSIPVTDRDNFFSRRKHENYANTNSTIRLRFCIVTILHGLEMIASIHLFSALCRDAFVVKDYIWAWIANLF